MNNRFAILIGQVLYQSAHDDWVLDTVFSTDGSHLVTVSRDRSMKLILVEGCDG